MSIFSWLFRLRDKPQNFYHFSGWPFVFGRSASGKKVNEFTAMQTTAVYACVRILAESIASLPLQVYEYKGQGKERVPGLYPLLPNRMNVDRDEHGEIVYTYTPMSDSNPKIKGGSQIKLRRQDVLHIPGLGFDGLVGYSPIAMACNAVGMTLA